MVATAQLKKRIGDENPKSIEIIPDQELKRVRDKTNDFNGFLMACEYGSLFCVKMMVDYKFPQINKSNSNKSTGLHIACERNHIEIVKYIINNGPIKLLEKKDSYGRTPLHCAIVANNVKVASVLIDYIKNLETKHKYLSIKDKDGNTPDQVAYKLTAFKCKSPPGTLVPANIFKS